MTNIGTVFKRQRKDEVERRLNQLTCSGQLTLRDAQQQAATNWQALYAQLHR